MASSKVINPEQWLKDNKNIVGFRQMPEYKLAVIASKNGKEKEILSESTGGQAEHIEVIDATSLPTRQKQPKWIKRHLRRFWCCYVVVGVIGLAIFLPLFFLYAFPAIAQLMVEKAHLNIYSAMLMNPSPDSVTVSLSAGFKIPKGFKVRLDPIALSLFNRNVTPIVPYINIALPEETFEGKANISITNQTVTLLDRGQFIDFLTVAVYEKTFKMSAKGTTTAHLGALRAKFTLDKDVELNGLWALNGFSIQSAGLVERQSDGTNLQGVAVLPNYSLVTFALGNVTLNLQAGGLILGQAVIDNVVLTPGNNTVSLRGSVSIETILQNLGTIIEAEKDAILSGNIALSASGNSTVYNGVHILYYEEVLNNLVITAQVSIVSLITDTIGGLVQGNSSSIASAISGWLGNSTTNEMTDLDSKVTQLANYIVESSEKQN
ncbi:hypothetical protein TCE0_017f03247 [Talaromyces pinophilus]|uniref:Uncharacterized protein n=1 Tax=Talaromyces pinophilus TaxID=128442 RepID=A0A6V8H1G3_TALPI|nr:hypothetical protein TCE0_017f03247 [Talaromyces pinophilus]